MRSREAAASGELVGISRVSGKSGNQRSASSTKGAAPFAVEGSERGAEMRSFGRWARPVGRLTVNALPLPSSLSMCSVPPCRRTSSCTSASPMPAPSCVRARAPGTRWNRSNTRGNSSGAMAVPCCLVGARFADSGRDVAGGVFEKALIIFSEGEPRAHGREQKSREAFMPGLGEWQDPRLRRRFRPCAARQGAESFGETVDRLWLARVEYAAQRPGGVAAVQCTDGRARRAADRESRRARELRLSLVLVQEIQQRARDVVGIVREDACRVVAYVLGGLGLLGGAFGELAQHLV